MTRTLSTVLSLGALAGLAHGQATIEFLPPGYLVTDASYDGSVLVGNVQGDGSYETFRWTAETGVERLGLASVPAIGKGAGSPDVSYDGTRISASILSSDNALTQGLWDIANGWLETMPPSPPDGATVDGDYGSAWGLSGDGTTLTGFYWLASNSRAQGSTWSEAGGMVALPQTFGRSARVNAASFDGSVVAGWEESPTGPWIATAWRNGVKHTLIPGDYGGGGMAECVSRDGSIVAGSTWSTVYSTRLGCVWTWDGATYQPQVIGYLPGTVLNSGRSPLNQICDDGSMAVGVNQYTFNPGGPADGIVWTPGGGLVKDTDFLASLGLSVPSDMDIRDFNVISPDGRVICGIGLSPSLGGFQTFMIRLTCPSDFDRNGFVNGEDFDAFAALFIDGAAGADVDGNGFVNGDDFDRFVANFEAGC